MELTPEQEKTLKEFTKKFVDSQKDCPPKLLHILRDNPKEFLLKGK